MKRQFSAGGVVYRKFQIPNSKFQIRWLVVRPKGGDEFHSKIKWQLPKGWIDKGETSQEAALREVKEEGGVEAKIIDKIDTIQWFFKDVYEGDGELTLKTVTFYLMEWQKDLEKGPDWETAEVAWLPYQEAYQKLTFKNEKEILKKGRTLLGSQKDQLEFF